MKLVIVESPGKIRTIQGYLGSDFLVKATVGHCFDIHSDKNIDMKNNYEVTYQPIKGKEKVIKEIRDLAKKADTVYISSDPDREGEAIGWHIAHLGIGKHKDIKRAVFHEITKTAILKAIANPTTLNEHLYHAQQARGVLDLLVGFKVSPILWYKVCRGTSAGRVQSIGLQLIVDRQKEIDNFKVEEFWTINGTFLTVKKQKLETAYKLGKDQKIKSETEANELLADIKKSKLWNVATLEKTRKKRHPNPIFETSTLQQFCFNVFGWDSRRTMGIAQHLYEQGLITYHRTDSTNISEEAIKAIREIIQTQFGGKYLPPNPNIFKSKDKNAQEAHEGIRPSHLDQSPKNVSATGDELKLYEAIYLRFLACQMSDAEVDATHIEVQSGKHTFVANGQILVFDGFLKVDKFSTSKEEILPQVNQDEKVDLLEVTPKQNFTKPPAAYNVASFVKKLKDEGVGRPSTYATIMETLVKRTYVTKDGKVFRPTDLGIKVCEFLQKNFAELMNIGYTARIEEQLDDIADNQKIWYEVVDGFFKELKKRLEAVKDVKKEKEITDITCPVCKKNKLVVRFGKFGKFYGCDGYAKEGKDKCVSAFKIGENGEPIKVEKKKVEYLEGKQCNCGGKLIIRESKRTGSKFCGCSNFPKCRRIYDLNGELIERKNDKE